MSRLPRVLVLIALAASAFAQTPKPAKTPSRFSPHVTTLPDVKFAPAITYDSAGGDVRKVIVADMNNDGIPDIVALNRCRAATQCPYGTVSILLGVGDGTFQPPLAFPSGGYQAESMDVADFNRDGNLDVVVVNLCSQDNACAVGSIEVFYGNGDGTLRPGFLSGSAGQKPFDVSAADVNHDGLPDITVLDLCVAKNKCSEGNLIEVSLNNGSSFDQGPRTILPSQISHTITVADVNGDGKPDLVVPSAGMLVMLGNGDGSFAPGNKWDTTDSAASVVVADVNHDGKMDLVAASQSNCTFPCDNSQVSVLLGNGDGTFGPPLNFGFAGSGAGAVAVGDVNGDGNPDVVMSFAPGANGNNMSIELLLGKGDGTFQVYSTLDPGPGFPNTVAIADLNADSKPDIVDGGLGGSLLVGVLINGGGSTTKTTLASSVSSSIYGQPITLTATVVPRGGGGVPTGSITFYDGSSLGTVPLTQGTAALAVSSFGVGTHSLTASYSGDSFFVASTSTAIPVTVKQALSTTALTSGQNPSFVGQNVAFTATVTGQYGGAASGAITFKQGATVMATLPLTGNVATFHTTYPKAGTFPMVALYSGDNNLRASMTKSLSQVVQVYPATVKLASTPNPSVYGGAVTMTATVSSSAPSGITGTVTFKSGATVLKTVTLTAGKAAAQITTLPVGSDSLTATYIGDTSNAKATSPVVAQKVNQAKIGMALVSSPNPALFGHAVKLTATLTSNGSLPAGSLVTFGTATTTLGTAKIGSTGVAIFSTTALPRGTYAITASYAGDANHTKASASVNQTVN